MEWSEGYQRHTEFSESAHGRYGSTLTWLSFTYSLSLLDTCFTWIPTTVFTMVPGPMEIALRLSYSRPFCSFVLSFICLTLICCSEQTGKTHLLDIQADNLKEIDLATLETNAIEDAKTDSEVLAGGK